MKLTNATLAIIATTVVLLVGMVVLLTAIGKDATQLTTFLATILIPSVIGLVGVQKSSRAEANSAQAVHNTNGRMSELVGAVISAGGTVPPGYEDVVPSLPISLVPTEFQGDEQGPRP